MSPDRAREIWHTRSPFGELVMSPQEEQEVRGVWKQMPGFNCFADALIRIANSDLGGAA